MIAWWRKRKEKKNKGSYSKIIVFLVIILNVWFARKTLNIYAIAGSEPVTLITAWFAFTVGELFLLARLKGKEIEKGEDDERDNTSDNSIT